jgi:hypothetical protein
MTKAIVLEKGLSPDEQALLQLARDLGVVGALLEEVRRKDEEAKKKAAYDDALRIATTVWQQAMESGAKIARVEITVENNGVEGTAIYPPVPRSKTKTTGSKRHSENYPDALVTALKEEARKRGAVWYGVQNAIRTKWGKAVYERFTATIPADSAAADSDSITDNTTA